MQPQYTTVTSLLVDCPHRVPMLTEMPPRFRAMVAIDAITGCWNWIGRLDRDGYGRVWWRNHDQAAHRIVFQLTKDHILADLVLHHICRNKRCVNPAHLEPLTNAANIQLHSREHNRRRDYCKRGHLNGNHAHTCPTCAKIYNSREYKEQRRRCLSSPDTVPAQWLYAYRQTTTG